MYLAFDLGGLLDNTASILASLVALAGIVATILTLLGKHKLAQKVKEAAETIKTNEKDIIEATDTIKTLVEGIDKVKEVFRPLTASGDSKPNAGEIVKAHAADTGMLNILDGFVKKFGDKN